MPGDNVVKIAEKSTSSKSWKVVDALEKCLQQIKSGEILPEKIFIHFFDDPKGKEGFYTAGLTVIEHIGLLELSKLRVIAEGKL